MISPLNQQDLDDLPLSDTKGTLLNVIDNFTVSELLAQVHTTTTTDTNKKYGLTLSENEFEADLHRKNYVTTVCNIDALRWAFVNVDKQKLCVVKIGAKRKSANLEDAQ